MRCPSLDAPDSNPKKKVRKECRCDSDLGQQGTSLALVGAYVLAEDLGKSPNDHTRAFAAYETRMHPHVLKNQALAWRDENAPEEEGEAMLEEAKNFIEL